MRCQAVTGVSGNPSCDTNLKLRLSFRLLHLYGSKQKGGKQGNARNASSDNRGSGFALLAAQEDEEFLKFIKEPENETEKTANLESFETALVKLQQSRMKKFMIQPGAPTGRSAEQVMKAKHCIDPALRISILALAGLKLLALTLSEIRSTPALSDRLIPKKKSKEPSGDAPAFTESSEAEFTSNICQLLNATSEYVIDCFCGSSGDLFQLASKCLVQLLAFDLAPFHDNGYRIALSVLRLVCAPFSTLLYSLFYTFFFRVFQTSGGSTSKADQNKIRGITATCTRVLNILLSRSSSASWFHSLLSPDEGAFSNYKEETDRTFKDALLTQIRSSVEDPQLRLSALQLFRQIILLRERDSNLLVAEHADLVYRCVDEVATVLLHQGNQQKLAGLCCRIYVDFLMIYPMTNKVQQKRILFVVRNLSHGSVEGRRAMLSIVYELAVSVCCLSLTCFKMNDGVLILFI